jgi:hypothetical protein
MVLLSPEALFAALLTNSETLPPALEASEDRSEYWEKVKRQKSD